MSVPSADADDSFAVLRPRLFGIAYGITASVGDAQDVCQDAWLRWAGVDHSRIEHEEAYLVRLVSNAAIDRLRAAQARRETYVGPFLPEPLLTELADTPLAAAERADELTFAFLVLLDQLSATERTVVLLHDVFGYSFDEVAMVVHRTPAACRQIASRSRHRLRQDHDSRPVRGPTERALVEQLIVATMNGDVGAMMALLAEDVVQIDDGGAKQHAARRPIIGRDRVARFMINLAKRLEPDIGLEHIRVNGSAGLLLTRSGVAWLVFVFDFNEEGLLKNIFAQLNPEKLGHVPGR